VNSEVNLELIHSPFSILGVEFATLVDPSLRHQHSQLPHHGDWFVTNLAFEFTCCDIQDGASTVPLQYNTHLPHLSPSPISCTGDACQYYTTQLTYFNCVYIINSPALDVCDQHVLGEQGLFMAKNIAQ